MKLLIMQFPPVSCSFLPLGHKHLAQRHLASTLSSCSHKTEHGCSYKGILKQGDALLTFTLSCEVTSGVLTSVSVGLRFPVKVTPCILMERYWRFERTCCLHLLPVKMAEMVVPMYQNLRHHFQTQTIRFLFYVLCNVNQQNERFIN